MYFYEKSLKTHRVYTNPALTGANDKPSVGLRSSKVGAKEVYASLHLSALLTIHVIVSSRLLPPPPPTSEGATLGARKTEETTKMNTEYAVIKNQNKQTNKKSPTILFTSLFISKANEHTRPTIKIMIACNNCESVVLSRLMYSYCYRKHTSSNRS